MRNDLIDTVTLPRSFLSVLFLGVCLNVAATRCVWYAFFLCTDYYWETKRTIFFTADNIEPSQQGIFFQFVQVGFVSVCLKQKLYSVNIEVTQFFIFLWMRGINKAVFFFKLTLCVCSCQANSISCFDFLALIWQGLAACHIIHCMLSYKTQTEI